MELIYHPIFLEHNTGIHPESAERLKAVGDLPVTEMEPSQSILNLVHGEKYIQLVKETSAKSENLDPDTQLSDQSFNAALYGAHASIMAAESGNFALVRPPGHHAYSNHGSGFCLFNNIAIATKNLVNKGKRVLIFDFDGHFGDGTSSIFYNSSQVMYVSLHQYPAFPFKGPEAEIGSKEGRGFNINVTLPPFSGDDIAEDAFAMLLPIMKQFNPDYLGISAGFDAHNMDPLLDLRWSAGVFHYMGKHLARNFKNVFACLEGGYNTEELPICINNFLLGVNQKKMETKEGHTDSEILVWNEYEMRMNNLLTHLKSYWKI